MLVEVIIWSICFIFFSLLSYLTFVAKSNYYSYRINNEFADVNFDTLMHNFEKWLNFFKNLAVPTLQDF